MKVNFAKLFKLSRALLKLAEVNTDNGVLIFEGEPEVGAEAFVADENGELVPAADGEYVAEDNIYVIAEGKVAEIKAPEAQPIEEVVEEVVEEEAAEEEAPAEETTEEPADEKDERIKELEEKIAELEAAIAEKDAKIAELEATNEEFSRVPAYKEVNDENKQNVSLAEAVRKLK